MYGAANNRNSWIVTVAKSRLLNMSVSFSFTWYDIQCTGQNPSCKDCKVLRNPRILLTKISGCGPNVHTSAGRLGIWHHCYDHFTYSGMKTTLGGMHHMQSVPTLESSRGRECGKDSYERSCGW